MAKNQLITHLLPSVDRCSSIVPHWEKYWSTLKAKKLEVQGRLSILSTMARVFGPAYSVTVLLQFCYSVLQFAAPQIVNLLIDFVESDEPQWKGYFYTVLICAVTFINTVLSSQFFYQEYLIGLRIRSALTSAIFRKSVKLSNSGRKEMTGKKVGRSGRLA